MPDVGGRVQALDTLPRVLDQLLARLKQCFIHSGEIHPCRTFCPYQLDNERYFTETAGPHRLLDAGTRLGGRARRTRGGRT